MKAIVKVPRCPLRRTPSFRSEVVDEVILGWPVEVLEAADGWVELVTAYRYRGFAPADCLELREEQVTSWRAMPQLVFLGAVGDVLSGPRYQSSTLLTLLRGSLLGVSQSPEEAWRAVALPDGREGFLAAGHSLCPVPPPDTGHPDCFRRTVCRNALRYLGVPYRWGGKTPLGIDCSGLAFMAYWLSGVAIYRDADLKEGFPMAEVPRDRLCPADLLYYPGHVALYLGEGQYIHASGQANGVVIGSLEPGSASYRPDLSRKQLLRVGRLDSLPTR